MGATRRPNKANPRPNLIPVCFTKLDRWFCWITQRRSNGIRPLQNRKSPRRNAILAFAIKPVVAWKSARLKPSNGFAAPAKQGHKTAQHNLGLYYASLEGKAAQDAEAKADLESEPSWELVRGGVRHLDAFLLDFFLIRDRTFRFNCVLSIPTACFAAFPVPTNKSRAARLFGRCLPAWCFFHARPARGLCPFYETDVGRMRSSTLNSHAPAGSPVRANRGSRNAMKVLLPSSRNEWLLGAGTTSIPTLRPTGAADLIFRRAKVQAPPRSCKGPRLK